MTSIIACFNSDSALETNRSWDPNAEPPRKSSMDADIPAYFGINVPQIGQDEHRDQVFPRADFPRVAVALQAAQARGNGVVVTTQHVTVENRWWGVSAGLKVNVTWMLLGRALNWEAELPEKLRKEVRPSGREAEVSRRNIAGIWVAFFLRCQRYLSLAGPVQAGRLLFGLPQLPALRHGDAADAEHGAGEPAGEPVAVGGAGEQRAAAERARPGLLRLAKSSKAGMRL